MLIKEIFNISKTFRRKTTFQKGEPSWRDKYWLFLKQQTTFKVNVKKWNKYIPKQKYDKLLVEINKGERISIQSNL